MKSFKKNKSPLANYQFHIDTISAELIAGWAVNKDNIDANSTIEVRSGDTLLWQTQANIARDDLKEAGFGDAAFAIYPKLAEIKYDIESIDIYIDGHKANSEPYPYKVEATKIEDYQCFVDHIGEEQILGWARYTKDSSHKPLITLNHGEITVGHAVANQARQDLIDANIGDGHYKFTLNIDIAKFNSTNNDCVLCIDGKEYTPVSINLDQESINRAKVLDKFKGEIESFESLLSQEQQRIQKQINTYSGEQKATINTVTNVCIENISEISARVKVLEQAVYQIISK